MILEGILTTKNVDGSANISPMGPRVDADMSHFELRPFQPSASYQNLKRTRQGVFHVTDNVEMIARAAIGPLDSLPQMQPAGAVEGFILSDACRWYAFRVTAIDDDQPRSSMQCEVVESGRLRDYFGLNRAKHAVLEAAILATRTTLLPAEEIIAQYRRLAVIVEKTAGPQEQRAFALLDQFISNTVVNVADG